MSALATDGRSIGQVLYESEALCSTTGAWREVHPAQRDRWERAAEIIFRRGFDAGQASPKTPTPKAKAYRDALVLLLAEAKHALDCVDEEEKRDALRARITKAEAVLR